MARGTACIFGGEGRWQDSVTFGLVNRLGTYRLTAALTSGFASGRDTWLEHANQAVNDGLRTYAVGGPRAPTLLPQPCLRTCLAVHTAGARHTQAGAHVEHKCDTYYLKVRRKGDRRQAMTQRSELRRGRPPARLVASSRVKQEQEPL